MLLSEVKSTDAPGAEVETVAFARWPVAIIAGVVGVFMLAISGRYGYFGDELYFVAAGHHLDFGYVDQPPLVPFLALISDTLAPGSVSVLRIPAILATVAGIVVAALTARELGGRRRAQVIAAATYAVAPTIVTYGHLLSTASVDLFFWTTITWLLVRWLRTRQDRLLLWAGVVTAVDLQVKYLIGFFWVIAAVAILIAGPRDIFRSKMLWLGAGIAVLTTVPSLLWQATRDWPQLAMAGEIAKEDADGGGALGFLQDLGLAVGIAGIGLALYGLWRSVRLPQHRFLAITAVATIIAFILTAGRAYYAVGVLPVLWALGAVGLDGDGTRRRRWVTWAALPVFALSLVMVAPTLPLAPVESLRGQDDTTDPLDVESVGWPQLADDVAAAYHALPEDVRRHTAVIGDSYWSASVIDVYGPERGLPAVYSASRGFWYFGVPPESATNVLYIGDATTNPYLKQYFGKLTKVATVDNKMGVNNAYQGSPIYLCAGRNEPWSKLWPQMRSL